MNSSSSVSVNDPLCSYEYDSIGDEDGNTTCPPGPDDYEPNRRRSVEAKLALCFIYALIFVAGVVGNCLVIYVILRFAKMHSVTNQYICNLAISDTLYLVGLSLLIVTVFHETWIFGVVMCKVFYILTSINSFAGVFTLTVMSADRYLAVCHPISSIGYRTPTVSRWICVGVWLASLIFMIPICVYANTESNGDRESCVIRWPIDDAALAAKAFIWYAFLIGFAIPVTLISVFYTLVVVRLKTAGPGKKSQEKKKTHRKVTKMVLAVIAAYVICWLPYWIIQVTNTFIEDFDSAWVPIVLHIATVLSNTNSMLNPVLYAFIAETFRKSFIKALCCASLADASRTLPIEHSASAAGGRIGYNRPPEDRLTTLELEGAKSAAAAAAADKGKNNEGSVDQLERDNVATVDDSQAL